MLSRRRIRTLPFRRGVTVPFPPPMPTYVRGGALAKAAQRGGAPVEAAQRGGGLSKAAQRGGGNAKAARRGGDNIEPV